MCDLGEDALLLAAVNDYLMRQSGELRVAGVFVRNQEGTGNKFVWYPASQELRKCCYSVAFSRRYQHCKSAAHVASVFGVKEEDIIKKVRSLRRETTNA